MLKVECSMFDVRVFKFAFKVLSKKAFCNLLHSFVDEGLYISYYLSNFHYILFYCAKNKVF